MTVASACSSKNCGNVFLLKETSKIFELMERDIFPCHSCKGTKWQKFIITDTNSSDIHLATTALLNIAAQYINSKQGTAFPEQIDLTELDDNKTKYELIREY